MSLSPEDIQSVLAIAPLAWVGIYGAGGESGTLRVIAAGGKCTGPDLMSSPGGCNVVDGPALEILAQQSRPRIWICDGHVTGIGDRGAVNLTLEASQICKQANIKRIPTLDEAIPYMRQLARK